jgi:AAA domain
VPIRLNKTATSPTRSPAVFWSLTKPRVDVPLMHSLVRAVPNRARLILVGGVDQLPSVGPGTVLHELIESGVVPTVSRACKAGALPATKLHAARQTQTIGHLVGCEHQTQSTVSATTCN